MSVNDLNETVEEALKSGRNRLTAIYIGVLAVLLAICAMGGNNADKAAMANNISAANSYAFFQAKNLRQSAYKIGRDELLVMLAVNPDLSPQTREQIQKIIQRYSKRIARYDSEPETGEGKKELLIKARFYEKLRDDALKRDPFFDFGNAFLQIAIVLASVSLIFGGPWMLGLSVASMTIGTVLMVNGFYLFADIPLTLPGL